MTDLQLDNDLIPLLHNQQTTDVLRMENTPVRRLAECMGTRGAIATNFLDGQTNQLSTEFGTGLRQRVTYEDVLRECAEIRGTHGRCVERAVRAVLMLKDKFEWKQHVEVEEPEPEELEWIRMRTRKMRMRRTKRWRMLRGKVVTRKKSSRVNWPATMVNHPQTSRWHRRASH